jgi:hypothetical protein
MASSILLSDNGVSSGSAGLKSTAGNDGVLLLQTTTSGGTATTAVTLDNAQNMGLGVTPSAWYSTNSQALQFGAGSAYSHSYSGSTGFGLSYNCYSSTQGGGWKYVANGYANIYEQSGGVHAWYNAASGTAGGSVSFTQAMTLDASGNLIVGGTTTFGGGAWWTKSFTVNGSTGSTSDAGVDIIGYRTGDGDVGGIGFLNAASSNARIATIYGERSGANNSGSLSFHTMNAGTSAERARINSSGFFKATNTGGYIGATGPYYEFISSDVSTNQTFIIYNNSSSITQEALFFIGAARATTNNTFYAIGYYNYGSGTYKFRVADSGNVTNTNNSYGAISDIKLKENITDATPKLEQLNQVRVVNYNFIGSNEKQLGVIAQELEQIFPGMVEESPDTERVTTVGEDGQEVTNDVPTGTTTKSVKYSVFVPMLIKAIQEQQAIITQLQADVAALKGTP